MQKSIFNKYMNSINEAVGGQITQSAIDILAAAQDSDDIKQIKTKIREAVTILQRAMIKGEIK